MDATSRKILGLISEMNVRFVVPVYQRPYSWDYDQCAQLLHDIVACGRRKAAPHFTGSIVTIQDGSLSEQGVVPLLLIDGQLIASNAHDNKAAGLEAGYDLATTLGLPSFSIIPFARYDGYFHVDNVFCNKWTAGLNTSLPLGFTLKAEAAWMNPSNAKHTTMVDISIGWQHEF